MLYYVWLGSLWADSVRTKCGIYSACMLNHVLNLFSQASFTIFFLILTYSLPNSSPVGTVLHCWRGGGGRGWPEGWQSRHIRINPMFNCVIFVKVCDFAETKSIQNKKKQSQNKNVVF